MNRRGAVAPTHPPAAPRLRRLTLALLALLAYGAAHGARADETLGEAAQPCRFCLEPLFYQRLPYGSESQFNPLTSALSYSIDTLQLPASFTSADLGGGLEEVARNLADPGAAIDETGGGRRFVNRQILPIDGEYIHEAVEMIPNYALHLIGGGVVYRKNAEWFAAHGVPFPRLSAAILAMAAEYIQEGLEKPATDPDDEIADIYIFRPIGILLFSYAPFARFWSERMHLVEWSSQVMFSPQGVEFTNVGESYAIRPTFFGLDRHRPFVYFGLNPLVGTSHRVGATDSLSWGAGAAMVEATTNRLVIRPSGGLFWDRKDSLLASLIFNTTDDLAMRLNVYPGVVFEQRWWSPGFYVGVKDHGDVELGISLRIIPSGLSVGSR